METEEVPVYARHSKPCVNEKKKRCKRFFQCKACNGVYGACRASLLTAEDICELCKPDDCSTPLPRVVRKLNGAAGYMCSGCGEYGHTVRGCPQRIVATP